MVRVRARGIARTITIVVPTAIVTDCRLGSVGASEHCLLIVIAITRYDYIDGIIVVPIASYSYDLYL